MRRIPTTIVIPTLGRASLTPLVNTLTGRNGPRPEVILVVDDRRTGAPLKLNETITVLRSQGMGPAGARNLGWRSAHTPWVSFLDDDVLPDSDWLDKLCSDIADARDDIAGIQGQVRVPLPLDRRPTDFERSTAGLETAQWITADMTYRRDALRAVGGFDERFKRAYREDADLGLRITQRCGRIVAGTRAVSHPVRREGAWISVRQQRGNGDDILMSRLHGRRWHERAHAGRGRFLRHTGIVAAATTAVGLAARGHRRGAALSGVAWLAGTAELMAARIVPGPRDPREITRMVVTSAVIPFAAVYWRGHGIVRHRTVRRGRKPSLVLFDRDGTLVRDVPYNGDPSLVRPMPEAVVALDELRRAGIAIGVVTNQSAVAHERITEDQLTAVNARIEELLGPFDVWEICRHAPADDCECRKPKPMLILHACKSLGFRPRDCVVIGDIGSDIEAAQNAGATGILVPTDVTKTAEVQKAKRVEDTLLSAVRTALGGVQ